jgi:arsenate reductase
MPTPKTPVIYHNPRCSKSREALSILKDQGLEPLIIEYLKSPLSSKELEEIIKKLGIPAREVLRKKEVEYKQWGLDNPHLSDQQIIEIVAKHPILLERPIVLLGNKAIIARPPETIHAFLAAMLQR